jgi:transcriptional regulator with GAF, ATPase, and Fis domain
VGNRVKSIIIVTKKQPQHIFDETQKTSAYLSFLCKAVQQIGASLDYKQTLHDIANSMVPELSDWCSVDIVQQDGQIQRLAVAHKDPKKIKLAQELMDKFPPTQDAKSGTPKVLRTGEPETYNAITDDMLVAGAKSPEHLRLMRALQIHSLMTVPIKSGDSTLGAITFVWAESGHDYNLIDLTFAQTLAAMAANAIVNARLYSTINH